MPTVLRRNQHELCKSDETPLLMFGTLDTGYLTTTRPAIAGGEVRNGDVEQVREDGVSFGEDYEGGKSVTFEVAALSDRDDDPGEAGQSLLSEFEREWKRRELRDRARTVAVLRSSMAGGRVRRAYGRPRRWEETESGASNSGLATFVCDFLNGDGKWYDDVEQSMSCSLFHAGDEGGVVAPVVAPIITTDGSVGPPAAVNIGGQLETWPVVTFHAGTTTMSEPRLRLGPLTFALDDVLRSRESVTIDPRPWRRVVTRSDGASRAGKLTYDTDPMRFMQLEPGQYEAAFSAVDASATAWCQIRWRDAWQRW